MEKTKIWTGRRAGGIISHSKNARSRKHTTLRYRWLECIEGTEPTLYVVRFHHELPVGKSTFFIFENRADASKHCG